MHTQLKVTFITRNVFYKIQEVSLEMGYTNDSQKWWLFPQPWQILEISGHTNAAQEQGKNVQPTSFFLKWIDFQDPIK